jgi:tetratricopeptide (TPR) repeat protein
MKKMIDFIVNFIKSKRLFLLIIILVLSLGVNLRLLWQRNRCREETQDCLHLSEGIRLELENLKAERDELKQKNKEFQDDTVSYLELISNLQQDNEEITQQLQAKNKELEAQKKACLQAQQEKIKQIKRLGAQKAELEKKIKQKEQEIASQKKASEKEKALFYYNLGVAYAKAGLYGEAEEAYKQSLKLASDNPEAYYNLGLLYENIRYDTQKARQCYQKYLELKPDAEDKKEVQHWIGILSTEKLKN